MAKRYKFKKRVIHNNGMDDTSEDFEFDTLDELKTNQGVIKRFSVDHPDFFFWSCAGRSSLVAVYGNYKSWWTVGYIENMHELGLPKFDPPREEVKEPAKPKPLTEYEIWNRITS
jgi:hypothetical protein